MDERVRFVGDAQRGFFNFTELCERYGISRKTGYKWLDRYEAEGAAGLVERSRRPHHCPHRTPEQIEAALIDLRKRYGWGVKKLRRIVAARHPAWDLPARSTCFDLLKRHGLTEKRRRGRKRGHPGRPMSVMSTPNAVWSADFKGQFKTGDGVYCYPLTVADGYSRFLLGCRGLTTTATKCAKTVFLQLFQEYGLPDVIRTDNGIPFASNALGRLSDLSVWWIKLGIRPELIEPASPSQNGRHERMHRTLKAKTARPPAATLRAQQRRFDEFRAEFNSIRPHEGLGLETPASCYSPSTRQLPRSLPRIEYPGHYEVRLVSANAGIRWKCVRVNVSTTLSGEHVGLEEVGDGLWDVYFGRLRLGRLDERKMQIEDALGKWTRRKVSPMSPD